MRDHLTLTERVERIEKFFGSDVLDADSKADCHGYEQAVDAQARYQTDKIAMHTERTTAATAFEEIITRIAGSTGRIYAIAENLEEIGTRILGPTPTNNNESGDDQNPEGTLGHAHLALNRLDNALTRLHSAAVRIERI